jgi:hypothetical protein
MTDKMHIEEHKNVSKLFATYLQLIFGALFISLISCLGYTHILAVTNLLTFWQMHILVSHLHTTLIFPAINYLQEHLYCAQTPKEKGDYFAYRFSELWCSA